MAHIVIVPQKKIMYSSFLNSGTLIVMRWEEWLPFDYSLEALEQLVVVDAVALRHPTLLLQIQLHEH